jgi:hypothetical protein
MLLRMKRNEMNQPPPATSRGQVRRILPPGAVALFMLLALFPASYMLRSQQPNPNQPIGSPEASRLAPGSDPMHDQQNKKANVEGANLERKRQIADDSAKLLKLATDLKAEVDKTSKDTLSLGVIRKAEEIEKLAHSVKEKMKLTMGGN